MMNPHRAFCFVVLLSFTPRFARAEDGFVLVKNKQNPIGAVSPTDVRNIYTGKTASFETGPVQLVFCKTNMAGPTWLAEKILDVPIATLFAKIRQEVFRERMNKPLLVDTDALVIDAVKTNTAALGIVTQTAATVMPKDVVVLPIAGGVAP